MYTHTWLFKKVEMASFVKALKSNEYEVVAALEKDEASLDSLLTESAMMGVVSQEVKKRFEELDQDAVPRSLQVRYLLLHVYQSLEGLDWPRLCEHWMKELAKHVPGHVIVCSV